jgi:signal transduction histidine kinase
MIRRSLVDRLQLTNKASPRNLGSYAYLLVIGALTVAANYLTGDVRTSHADNFIDVLYLVVVLIILSLADVRMERGRINLSAIAVGAAAILLNPLDATIVGLSVGVSMAHRGRWPITGNAIITAADACLGACVAVQLRSGGTLTLESRIFVLAVVILASWVLVCVGLSIRTGESIPSIVSHNFTAQFYAAFGYFALASLLTSYVLDGSARGYLLSSVVFVLAFALTDTIAGRRLRRVLESELSDADRHLFHSRAVEGVVHNLRNHVATAVGYLKEIDSRRLDPVDREAVETATDAVNDAVTVLRSLAQGATPRVSYATEPIDLNEVASRALGMARPRARSKEIELALRESPEPVTVKADPLLLREVITNLINNAIDAAPQHGHVDLATGRRGNGWPYLSVSDNGPGVLDENRHHLFEPHFTTKESGTGLGLFMSFGIVREHQGDLKYDGGRRGAVFTVTLPPFVG